MLKREDFDALAAQITSPDSRDHAPIIAGLVRWLNPTSCVEVGTDTGGMAIHIARALQENAAAGHPLGRLTCIDDFSLRGPAGRDAFWYHLGACRVGEVVELSPALSTDPEAWPERVDFAFIDGDHSYEGCERDVAVAWERGARCIIIHDVQNWWGPREWLDAMDKTNPGIYDILRVPFCGGLAVLLRREEMPPPAFTREKYPKGCI